MNYISNLVILFIASVFLAEVALNLNPVFGFLVYSVIILSVLIASSNAENLRILPFLLIVPVARASIVFLDFSLFWKTVIFYTILFFLTTYYCIELRINPGFSKKHMNLLPLAIVLGIIIGALGAFFKIISLPSALIAIVPLIVYAEEVLFRGLIQREITKESGAFFAIITTAALLGIFTLGFGFYAFLFFLISNLILGVLYNSTKNLFLTGTINLIISIIILI